MTRPDIPARHYVDDGLNDRADIIYKVIDNQTGKTVAVRDHLSLALDEAENLDRADEAAAESKGTKY